MSKSYEFLKECGVFYVLTVNDDKPCGRPFGAVMEYENKLYITTANMKAVYKQMKANTKIQIIALKGGTRDWIRIDGNAVECMDLDIKQKMLEECPILQKRYDSANCEYFALFELVNKKADLNINGEFISVD